MVVFAGSCFRDGLVSFHCLTGVLAGDYIHVPTV